MISLLEALACLLPDLICLASKNSSEKQPPVLRALPLPNSESLGSSAIHFETENLTGTYLSIKPIVTATFKTNSNAQDLVLEVSEKSDLRVPPREKKTFTAHIREDGSRIPPGYRLHQVHVKKAAAYPSTSLRAGLHDGVRTQ